MVFWTFCPKIWILVGLLWTFQLPIWMTKIWPNLAPKEANYPKSHLKVWFLELSWVLQIYSDPKVRGISLKMGLWKYFWYFCVSPGLVTVINRVQKCSNGTGTKTYFLYLKWVLNAKISAQKTNFEKNDHLLGKVTEFYFQTLIKEWPGDLGKIWYHFSEVSYL